MMNIAPNLPNDRSFGFFFSGLLFLIFSWNAFFHGHFFWIVLGISTFFFLSSCLFPKVLRPLNTAWYLLGKLLHKITNPLIMGFIFFIIITPLAILRRLTKSEAFPKHFDSTLPSYWIKRLPPGPDAHHLKDQY